MKLDDALSTLTHFFNDIIGAIIPGLILGGGLLLLHSGIVANVNMGTPTSNTASILFLTALSFAAGHGLLAIYTTVVEPALKVLRWVKGSAVTKELEDTQCYKIFKQLVNSKLNQSAWLKDPAIEPIWRFHDLRNIALSISTEGASLGRRFMFISLLCSGMGTALILLALDFLVCSLWWPAALVSYRAVLPAWLQFAGLAALGLLCIRRGDAFFQRAMSIPFPVATAELVIQEPLHDKRS